MATYKGIQGYTVQSLASDPTASEVVGQLWYNSGSNVWKIGTQTSGAWAAVNSLTTGRSEMAACGTVTAAIISGGEPPTTAKSESWNGTSWTEVADLQAANYGAGGAGTSTAALAIGANASGQTEIWNGSAWAETNNLNTGRARGAASVSGTTTACLFAGGQTYPTLYAVTESWNGTSWTEVADLNLARNFPGGLGVQTAMLCVGGASALTEPTSLQAVTESWNGTAWTEVNNINTARNKMGASGITTSGLVFGGSPSAVALTEKYDGTSWTEVGDLGTAESECGGFGTSAAALCAGGNNDPTDHIVQEWADPLYAIKTVTTS